MRDFDAKRNAFGGGVSSAAAGARACATVDVMVSCSRVRPTQRARTKTWHFTHRGGWDSARNLGRNAWAKRGGEAVFFGKDFRFGTNEDVTSKLRLPLRVDDTLVARGTRRLTGSYRNEAVLAWKTEQPLRGV